MKTYFQRIEISDDLYIAKMIEAYKSLEELIVNFSNSTGCSPQINTINCLLNWAKEEINHQVGVLTDEQRKLKKSQQSKKT